MPLIKQVPLAPLVYPSELVTTAPQANVMGDAAANTAIAAGLTVIILDTGASVLPHASVADQVSVIVPPQGPGAEVCVDVAVPLTKQVPLPPLLYANTLTAGIAPQATVIFVGGVNVGNTGGLIVITWEKVVLVLLQASLATHVFVYVPPQKLPINTPVVFI